MDRERADLYLQLTAPQRVRIPNIGDPEYVGRIARAAVADRQAHELRSFVLGWCTATDQKPAARRLAMMSLGTIPRFGFGPLQPSNRTIMACARVAIPHVIWWGESDDRLL